jgi:3-phosphoshikimate 1-carboxyvinyltransferase
MDAVITPSKVSGAANAPPSKSYTHRAIILASLAEGTSELDNVLLSEDSLYTLEACKALGVKARQEGSRIVVEGSAGELSVRKERISVGNSGSTMRMMSSIAALAKGRVVFDGTPRMRERPIGDLLDALKQLGVEAKSVNGNGCPPIEINGGGLSGGEVKVSGAISSQYITSLLLASPYARSDTTIIVTDELKSKPYVGITIDLMRRFGVEVENRGYREFSVPCGQRYQATRYAVEGDYSSASYFFAAAATTKSTVSIAGLEEDSVQGDKHLLDLLRQMGCGVRWSNGVVSVEGAPELKPITVDMGDYPDIVQTLIAAAAYAKGVTRVDNVEHLKHKETDRINAPANELRKMGVAVEVGKDYIEVQGKAPSKPRGADIDSHGDHRMVMSFTAAALGAEGKSIIRGAENVSKSFPDFFREMRGLGAEIELADEA